MAAARAARAARGGPEDDASGEATLDHELGWYAAQEVPALLDRLLRD